MSASTHPVSFPVPAERTELPLLIAFTDIARFTANCERASNRDVAAILDDLYARVCRRVVGAGGAVVKFLFDGALVVFPEDRVDAGVLALLDLKDEVDAWLAGRGWDAWLVVKAHFGAAIAGPYGPREYGHHDVIGSGVNLAASIETRGFALSAQAFRKLAPATRKRFKKHTPPITYIPAGARRP